MSIYNLTLQDQKEFRTEGIAVAHVFEDICVRLLAILNLFPFEAK